MLSFKKLYSVRMFDRPNKTDVSLFMAVASIKIDYSVVKLCPVRGFEYTNY